MKSSSPRCSTDVNADKASRELEFANDEVGTDCSAARCTTVVFAVKGQALPMLGHTESIAVSASTIKLAGRICGVGEAADEVVRTSLTFPVMSRDVASASLARSWLIHRIRGQRRRQHSLAANSRRLRDLRRGLLLVRR